MPPAPPTPPSWWSPPPTASSPRASTARTSRLPGRQDELVHAVAAANPNTVVVVNARLPGRAAPWREEVAAVLLGWFPGQEGGAALADVLTGAHEPGGRLPTTWGSLTAAPVTQVVPADGELPYTEGVFIGYRAWEEGRTPSYAFGHGLGYTDWTYESMSSATATAVPVPVSTPFRVPVPIRVQQRGRRSASATPVRGPGARSSRSIWRPSRPTPGVRPGGSPPSRASRRAPARASTSSSYSRAGPSRSGTRAPEPGCL